MSSLEQNEVVKLKQEMTMQLTECNSSIGRLNNQLTEEKERREQLKGAVYATDILIKRLEALVTKTETKEGKENGKENQKS